MFSTGTDMCLGATLAPPRTSFRRLMLAHDLDDFIMGQFILTSNGFKRNSSAPGHEDDLLDINRSEDFIFHR